MSKLTSSKQVMADLILHKSPTQMLSPAPDQFVRHVTRPYHPKRPTPHPLAL